MPPRAACTIAGVRPNRRELLAGLGIGGAASLAWALGCGGPGRTVRRRDPAPDEVRSWLRDAVARLAAVHPAVHVLAVRRQRTAAAIDVLGAGVARGWRDGVVATVRVADGTSREHATSELSAAGVAAVVTALGGAARAPALALPVPAAPAAPARLPDAALRDRVEAIARADRRLTSRVVYAAAMIDIDDCHVWSLSPTHDREQRLVRVRKRAVRAAWNGDRPVVAEAARGWRGEVDERALERDAIEDATTAALQLMTPGAFDERERDVILDPSLTASLVDIAVRALLTGAAARRPEVARRIRGDRPLAAPAFTLVDDPTAPGAYGGFRFDDDGAPAAPLRLIEAGRVVGALATGRGRRPGHVGPIEPAPSHLRLAAGTLAADALGGDGLLLDGALGASVDPSTDRVVIGAARARELRAGVATGRVYADVELVGELSALLTAISGIARETAVVALRDEVDGEPRWRSIEAPHLRTRGMVRARGRIG